MGFRTRSATPGTLLCLTATALLAVVSFNTPLLKSLYFLEATYASGQYAGTMRLGTLGYCVDFQGTESCVGPTVGYQFDPNVVFGINLFNIPTAVTKYLTYTLILHIVALGAAVVATIFGLLSHISSLSVLCFPTCFASIASSFALISLVLDLVMFYIAKARIDAVDGASASIGIAVWLTLAAWICAGLGGCAFGIGRCCISARKNREPGDAQAAGYYPAKGGYGYPDGQDDMRLHAIRDEQLRKKEQGLPSFQELERTPLNAPEDQYLQDEPISSSRPNGGLARDGSLLQGVGMGYGRRTPRSDQGYGYDTLQQPSVARRMSTASGMTAGNAGVGAGPGGVDVPPVPPIPQQGYGGYYGNQQHNYYDNYDDPYNQQPYTDPYNDNAHQYPPGSSTNNAGIMPMPTPAPSAFSNRRTPDPYAQTTQRGMTMPDPYAAGNTSLESDYSNPGPRVMPNEDPYGGYDDGLGAIGMAATSPNPDQGSRGYGGYPSSSATPIHVPQPQHLATHNSNAQALLRSPMSPVSQGPHDYAQEDGEDELGNNRPPSYGAVAGQGGTGGGYRNEKSGYR